MGDWMISIIGAGFQSNSTPEQVFEKDIDQMPLKFIEELRMKGHRIDATFYSSKPGKDLAAPPYDQKDMEIARLNDLLKGANIEIEKLMKEKKSKCEPKWLNEALNQGDGTYRP